MPTKRHTGTEWAGLEVDQRGSYCTLEGEREAHNETTSKEAADGNKLTLYCTWGGKEDVMTHRDRGGPQPGGGHMVSDTWIPLLCIATTGQYELGRVGIKWFALPGGNGTFIIGN